MRFPRPSAQDYQRSKKDPDRPPVFRDADFAMRFAQGRWSEDRLIEGVNRMANFRALPYGRSEVGPEPRDKIRDYWRRYVAAEPHGKRPDVLVVRAEDYEWALRVAGNDPTTASDEVLAPVVGRAVCGIEAENSLWVAKEMRDFATTVPLTRKDPKSPNIWVKDQDAPGLRVWMYHHQKPVVVVQVFYDAAYAMALHDILRLAKRVEGAPAAQREAKGKELGLFVKVQSYIDSRTGVATRKKVFVVHHSIATPFGDLQGKVSTDAKVIFGKNGKIMPYVHFSGGRLQITGEGERLLERIAALSEFREAVGPPGQGACLSRPLRALAAAAVSARGRGAQP